MEVDRIALLFMVSGLAAVVASPLSGWLADHAGKRNVIMWANVMLAFLFLAVARSGLGLGLVVGIFPNENANHKSGRVARTERRMGGSAVQRPLHEPGKTIV